ncbi:MAG TPA: hypothetical protein VMF61_03945 [Candidatus Acidoferrales bacterium]|nr:hypothetical protein [Candidatus Acidoferrales bacterium]
MKAVGLGLVAAALLAVLGGVPARAGDQVFSSTSSGKPPAPLPTPTSWPYVYDGSSYYPGFWPLCGGDSHGHHCRPPHAPIYPPPHPPRPPHGPTPPPRPLPTHAPPPPTRRPTTPLPSRVPVTPQPSR